MTSQINEYYPFDLHVDNEPAWVKAERLAFCENNAVDRHEDRLMNSLRGLLGKIFR